MPDKEEVKQPKIAIGLGMEFKLGPSRAMNVQTHVTQDDPVEYIHAQADLIASIAARQQAIYELDAYKDERRIELKRLEDAKIALDKAPKEFEEKKQSVNEEWANKINETKKVFEDSWNSSGRKGEYKSQPQHEQALKNLNNTYTSKLSDLEVKYQADVSNHKANINMLSERLEDTERSIKKREEIINPSNSEKKTLKLFSQG